MSEIEPKLLRIARATRPYRFALLAIIASLLVTRWLTLPSVVVVEHGDGGSWIQSTFRTGALIVDTNSRTATLDVVTNGDDALFSTLKAASSDGLNVWIGGGGQSVVVNALGTYTASRNISLGKNSLLSIVDGYDNIAIGVDSLKNLVGINAGLGPNQGHDNIAVGDHACESNLIGETNICIGGNSLKANTLNRNSVAIGFNALAAATAQENIAIGTNSSLKMVSGTQNITIGTTFVNATTGSDNIVMGHDSMGTCATGCSDNIAIGVDVLQNVDSVQNVGIGTFALRVTTGYNNVGIGIAAGFTATSGHDNTFIGTSTGNGITTGTSNTIIGANVTGLAAGLSNNIILADGDGVQRITVDSTGQTILPSGKGIQIQTYSGTAGTAMLRSFAGDPNGTVPGGIGSILMDTATPAIWQNTDGATAWTQFHNAFTTDSSVYYGDGSDGTCNFDGAATPVCGATLSGTTYTMTRDIMAMNSTVSSGVSVFESNFRFMVFGTLTGGGGGANINDSGDNAAGRLGGNCGGISSHFYAACVNGAASGANGTGAGGASSANSLAISQWSTQGTTAAGANGGGNGQGGGGGTAGANAGGGGGAITPQIASVGAFTGVGAWSGLPDKYGVGSPWGLYGTGGGGGGCTGGACTGGGGGGGGGMTFVGANQCAGTIAIKSVGGNGGAGVLGGGTSAGGGGGAGGGVVAFMYSHRAATCTTSVAAGTGGAGAGTGAAGGNGSIGTAQTYNLSGDGS